MAAGILVETGLGRTVHHMAAHSEATAVQALSRHQRRRESGIPTLSVMVGPVEPGTVTWRDWALSAGRWPIVVRSSGRGIAEDVAVAWMSQPWILDRLIDHAAPCMHVSSERVREVLAGGPCQEWSSVRDQVVAACSSRALEALCRRLLADPRDHAPNLSGAQGAAALIEGLSILDGNRAPGFLLVGTAEPEEAAGVLVDLAERCPEVPFGWVLSSPDYARLNDLVSNSRVQAVCREGVVAVHGRALEAVPDTVEASYAQAVDARDKVHEGPEAEEKARSAAEAFLYDFLESLPETAGLFELNGRLPADWGRHGCAEVDLLCRSRRLAVEIDGYYHFLDPDGYRRDRRKDVLLQQHGFLVLRFLADDIVSSLETILDTILSSLRWRDDQDR